MDLTMLWENHSGANFDRILQRANSGCTDSLGRTVQDIPFYMDMPLTVLLNPQTNIMALSVTTPLISINPLTKVMSSMMKL